MIFLKKIILLFLVVSLLLMSFGCIKVDNTEKDPVVENPEVPEIPESPEEFEVVIKPVDKINIDNLSILDEFDFDFDNDGNEEKFAMYSAAQRDLNGEIVWDDGQDWLFVVHDSDKDYVLVDEYVQLGSTNFNIYTIEEEFYIATYSGRTASLTLNIYHFNKENDTFEMTTPFNTKGNVNMMKSSNGY